MNTRTIIVLLTVLVWLSVAAPAQTVTTKVNQVAAGWDLSSPSDVEITIQVNDKSFDADMFVVEYWCITLDMEFWSVRTVAVRDYPNTVVSLQVPPHYGGRTIVRSYKQVGSEVVF
jgi:hypothetical protein